MSGLQQDLQKLLPTDQKPESAYLRAFRGLFPQGFIWGFNSVPSSDNAIQDAITAPDQIQDQVGGPDSIQDSIFGTLGGLVASTKFGNFISVFSTEVWRFQNRIYDLYKESIPGLSVELLPDWERAAGIPNACIISVDDLTLEERQCNVHAKIFLRPSGGLTKQFYIDYAATLGFTIVITEFSTLSQPFLVGPVGVDPFDIGGRMGDRINSSTSVANVQFEIVAGPTDPEQIARLQCEINELKPAHVVITWI